jgi:phenylpropionate dioxygenase-like ring-hydroxylating dioxygenase large terminal subunit
MATGPDDDAPSVPGGTGRWSTASLREWWYPACRSGGLGRRPVAIQHAGLPVVLFRDAAGAPRALVDRCPHRNVPLSLGRVERDGTLACGYHGWRFDGAGRCTEVPGLGACAPGPSPRDAASLPTREADGFVWIWPAAEVVPHREPFALPDLGSGSRVGEVVFERDIACTVHASVENALDVPHTAFLHGGLFRSSGKGPQVQAERRDLVDGVEVQYHGEPAAFGPLRVPGATFEHWDRFLLPSVAQVEYRIGDAVRITNSILHLPLSATRTRAWFVLRFRSPLPALVVAPIVRARGAKILQQDVDVLEAQTANIARFGGERYTSTPLDLLANAILRLLRQAERVEQGRRSEDAASNDAGAADDIGPTSTFIQL